MRELRIPPDRPGAVARLIRDYRRSQRPRWTQGFLAEEITGVGFPTSRSGIAHLERARPNSYNAELIAAAAYVLGIPLDEVTESIAQDFRVTYRVLRRQFPARRA